MAAIHDLLAQVQDPALRERLENEVKKLSKTKKYGLVYEEHLPECTALYDVEIKKGSTVARRDCQIIDIYEVSNILDDVAICHHKVTGIEEKIPLAELVSISEFGKPIYPYLKPLGTVSNAPSMDIWHSLIEADNYHALQLLEYLYSEKVDCIYIDPPYNTGSKDWKYNNDYVDKNDVYRHSKWLSFMEKRLKIAKKLLNPKDSVLIVAIDENEVHQLYMLLGQIFPGCKIQMVSVISNFAGASIIDQFNRVDEQLLFVQIGMARPGLTKIDSIPSEETATDKVPYETSVRWEKFLRSGGNSRRQDTKAKFFPVFIDEEKQEIVGCGDHLPLEEPITSSPLKPKGCIEQWPISARGTEACWQLSAPTFRQYLEEGRVKLGTKNKKTGRYAISFLTKGHMAAIERGELIVDGKDEHGTLILRNAGNATPLKKGKTIWTRKDYFAREYGSNLTRDMLPGRTFPYPKSVYAVRDAIRYYVQDKKDALIVDFFAGSGTTLHAVNLLNAEDNGKRRCVMVTNNAVSESEEKMLKSKGLKPGDDEWEALGIAHYITWPRTVCSIKGSDLNGEPLKGNYADIDKPLCEGLKANAAFFKLGFLDKNSVALGRQLKELIPILWMKAGSYGECPELMEDNKNMAIFPENHFAILINERHFTEFEMIVNQHSEIDTLFFVTDSDAGYREMISDYQNITTIQLYKDYLDNFRINAGR